MSQRDKAIAALFNTKKRREVYKDPIFGIPHYHNPALSRLITNRNPSTQMAQSMRSMFVKSSQRLKAVQANKPKYMHTRFNIDTLRTSPLMCFPHFQDMTEFLSAWFNSRDTRKSVVMTTTQHATFQAEERFSEALFLMLQEAVRASPVSSKPLRAIYNWYLQRDSIINQSRNLEKSDVDENCLVLELTNGDKIKIPKWLFMKTGIFDESMFEEENIMRMMREIKLEPPKEEDAPPKKPKQKKALILTEMFTMKPQKRSQMFATRGSFDYDTFHEEMEERRKADREVDLIAETVKNKYKEEILARIGWQ